MSDNEDLLGDDLGDQSLADYNLGNEEEEQLLADDYDNGGPQNVPTTIGQYRESLVPAEYPNVMEYNPQPMQYQAMADTECVVPNITVEVPNAPLPSRSTYAPYEPPVYEEHTVPPAIPAAPMESPQIVPSDVNSAIQNGDMGGPRERFISERPPGAQRLPQVRDIPDSLDKVIVPRGGYSRGRSSWRSAQFAARYSHSAHPYRRNNMHRGNFHMRASFPPPQIRPTPQIRPEVRPEPRPELRPEVRSDMRPGLRPDTRPDLGPEFRPERPEIRPELRPELRPEVRLQPNPEMRPEILPDMRNMRPEIRDMHPEIRDMHPDMRPEMRNMRPEMRDMRPEMRDMRPEMRDMRPEMRDMRPEMRDMRPEMREMRPEMRDMRPEMRDMHPEMRDMHPEMRDMRPEMRDMPPEMRDMRPEMREMRPEMRDMRPEMRDMRPDLREMRPEIRDMRPEMREIHPELRDMRPEMRDMRPEIRELRPEMRDMRPELREMAPELRDMRPEIRPDMPDNLRPDIRLETSIHPPMGPEISPERPLLPQDMPIFRPERPFYPRFQFRPDERPQFNPRPNFEPRFFRPNFPPRQNFLPMREIVPNASHMPQVTIRQALPEDKPNMDLPREPEVRMLPVPLPPNLPPGKKVLINPHFKGTFPPVDGPVKNIDDAAERFIAEQRNALARAAVRKYARRSPQRYIENTTIEIENELAQAPRKRNEDDDLLRRQEEFINANRAGLRRRMRSPSPPRRSPSPRPSPSRDNRDRRDTRPSDEDSEYKRRLREQESLRERVLRAKEVRRRKNAVALHKQLQDKEAQAQSQPQKEPQPTSTAPKPPTPSKPITTTTSTSTTTEDNKPDTTRTTPEKVVKEVVKETVKADEAEVNSTCETLTPPHGAPPSPGRSPSPSPSRALTPPLPHDSDDDLDLILGDIDGILSEDEDTPKTKETTKKSDPPKKPQVDLRSKLPPKYGDRKPQRQKIVFNDERDQKKKKDKSPPRRAVVSSTKADDTEPESKKSKKSKLDVTLKSKSRITYEAKHDDKNEKNKDADEKKSSFPNRRVILQRTITKDKPVFRSESKSDPTKPNPGIFSRAVRTAIGSENTRIVIKKDEPQIQYESDSDVDTDIGLEDSNIADVSNLPFGMTDTRLKTLAGNDVQNLILDKEERTAKITFKSTTAAESFKRKFNNKMVAASRLTVTLR